MNLRVPRRLRHSLRAEAEALRSRVTFGNCHLPTQWCADDGRHVIYRHEDDLGFTERLRRAPAADHSMTIAVPVS
jgi:hypothetical protein